MSRADVKVTLTPTDFKLVVECLEEAHQLLDEEVRDHTPGSEGWQADNQRRIHIERLLRELE